MPPSPAAKQAAQDFFAQLEEFSTRVFQRMKLPNVSPWGAGAWETERPMGAILHYTATKTLEEPLRWFMTPSFNARASANVVVGDCKVPWMDALASDLPLVAALPVTVVQCRKPDTESWHATWTCSLTYGIESVNIGELRRQADGSFNCWYPQVEGGQEWSTRWDGAQPINLFGRWFCPWVPEQLKTIIQVLRHAYAFLGTFQKPWILGHEQVQGDRTKKWDAPDAPHYTTDKRDPGPHFPLEHIRQMLFNGDVDLDSTEWFQKFSADQADFAVESKNAWILEWANVGGKAMDIGAAYSAFRNYMVIQPHLIGNFGSVGKLALRLLGYHVSDVTTESLTSDDYRTVAIFQRLQGLATDCQPGPLTRQALVERLQDRGFI